MGKPPARLLVAVAALVFSALPSAGDLVVFSGGHFLRVEGFRVEGEAVVLRFASGGAMRVGLGSVERIVDDEVEWPEPEAAAPAGDSGQATSISLGFTQDDSVPETPFGELIFTAAERHDLNPALVAAIVRAESAFDERAVSIKGARGLMQLMPATAHRFGVSPANLFNPEANIEAGTTYLAWLIDRYGDDLPRILAAYNAGEANVKRYGGVPPFRETRTYIRRIYGFLGLSPDSVAAL